MQRKTLVYSLLAIFFSFILIFTGACGKSSTTTASSTKSTTTSTVFKPTGDQTLTVNLGVENNTLDPNRASWVSERTILVQCFDGLLAFDRNLNVVPMVAKEMPTLANGGISADGLTYTLKLRNDVTWSDGAKLTAKDFVFSFKRLFDPAIAGDYESFYVNVVGGDAFFSSGSKTAAEQTALRDAIGVRAVDDYTLEIKLTAALPTFIDLLALWPVYPVRQDMVDAHPDSWAQPDASGAMPYYIGNGPFIIKEWVQNDHYTLVPNPNYWGTKPYLTKIIFKIIQDANTALAAYKNNELDQSGVPGGTQKATMSDPVLSPDILRYPILTTFGLRFNMTVAPFDNLLVRQAISCSIDRQSYIDKVRGGVGKVALSWIPPGMPDYDASLGQDWAFNPTKAQQLLAQAGYPGGKGLPTIKFQYSQSGTNPVLAAFVQEQLKTNLGVDITLEPYDSKALSALVNNKQFTWAWFGWGADYPDPDNWLPQLYGTNGGNNKQHYSNAQFDALSAAALKELDNTKRLQDWADAQKLLVADCPAVWIMYAETFLLQKPWVKNMVTTSMDGNVAGDTFLRNVYIQH